jgi:two-component system OmpR family sensor kinase
VSLRVRLLLAVGAVALIALVAADVATYSLLRKSLLDRVDQSLEASHVPLEDAWYRYNGIDLGRVSSLAPGTFVEIRDATGPVGSPVAAILPGAKTFTPHLPDQLPTLGRSSSANSSSGGSGGGGGTGGSGAGGGGPNGSSNGEGGEPHTYFTVGSVQHEGPLFRVRLSTLTNGYYLVLASPLGDTTTTLHRLVNIELAATGGALVAAALLGLWLVRLGLQPLSDVERTAEAIADGELEQRVPGANERTEVGRLASTLNTMLGRIENAFAARDATEAELRQSEERLRRFIADASHELRTPLAAIAAYAELFERGASEHPNDLARLLSGIRSETGRMGHLVEDLLLLARLDEGRPLERKPVELVALTGEAVDTATTVGPEWPVQMHAERPVEVLGDALRLRQVLDNLLANVRAHTPPGTPARVSVASIGGEAVISVSDRGPGLTPEQAERVFERFYRADSSRSRQNGGAGLGLGIVAAIVTAHGGQVAATSSPGAGMTFTVRLPLPPAWDGRSSVPAGQVESGQVELGAAASDAAASDAAASGGAASGEDGRAEAGDQVGELGPL